MNKILLLISLIVMNSNYSIASNFSVKSELQKCDSNFKRNQQQNWDRIIQISLELDEIEIKSSQIQDCARQIFFELVWLNRATVSQEKFNARFEEFKQVLKGSHVQDYQSSQSGLWGQCQSQEFMKLDSTLDKVKQLQLEKKFPQYEIKFLQSINSPELLVSRLREALVSDLKNECLDRRDEINSLITSLSRYVFRKIPSNFNYHPELSQSLIRFIEEEWQNPETGFWGPWYISGDQIIKLDDLSITFHIISYYKGEVKNWPLIINTLLSMKDKRYPNGWLTSDGEPCSHHYYDVVRLLRLGWPHMTEAQKQESRVLLRQILNWSISDNFDLSTGRFQKFFTCNSGLENETYEYGIKLWNELGFSNPQNNFWSIEALPSSQQFLHPINNK